MTAPQLTVSCASYKNNLFSGFSRLQEQQEFVDMTLAADGYLVKVHKNIVALASPYLKEMLQSTSSQNPVIFLNNVHHNVLTYLLEYIYLGEVDVPQDFIESFIQVSQSLHITGITKIMIPPKVSTSKNITTTDETQAFPQTESLSQNAPKSNLNTELSIDQMELPLVQPELPIVQPELPIAQPELPTPMITLDGTSNEIDRSSNIAASLTTNSGNNIDMQQFANNIQVVNIDHTYQANKNQDQQIDINNADTLQDLSIIQDYGTNTEIPQANVMEIDLSVIQDQHNTLVEKAHMQDTAYALSQNAIELPIVQPKLLTPAITSDGASYEIDRPSNFAASIIINSDHNVQVQQCAKHIQVVNIDHTYQANKNQDQHIVINPADTSQDLPIIEYFGTNTEVPQAHNMEIDLSLIQDQHNTLAEKAHMQATSLHPTISSVSIANPEPLIDLTQPSQVDQAAYDALKILNQFSVTERGSVEIIVSRFIYRSHHNSKGGRKHRWRCMDYRLLRCPAYIDSLDGRITIRKGIHNHAYHDDKIYKKHNQRLIFNSIAEAMESRDLPKNTETNENNMDLESAIDINVIPLNVNEADFS